MGSFQVQMQAKADQINASHRDAIAAFRRFAAGLAMLPESERQQIVEEIAPMERALLSVLATEVGNQRLAKLFGETT